jgi:hypothetical protein
MDDIYLPNERFQPSRHDVVVQRERTPTSKKPVGNSEAPTCQGGLGFYTFRHWSLQRSGEYEKIHASGGQAINLLPSRVADPVRA